ncbi:hypothetical protein AAHE18_14G197900 [Arachis hypogaea]
MSSFESFAIETNISDLSQQQQQRHIDHHHHPYYEALNTFMLFLSETLSMVIGTKCRTRGFLFLGMNRVLFHQLALVNSLAFEKRNLLSFGKDFDMSQTLNVICLDRQTYV